MAYIFSLDVNEISPIIEGKKGVYIIQAESQNNNSVVDERSISTKAESKQKEIRTQLNKVITQHYTTLIK
jgi:hypothetical protein